MLHPPCSSPSLCLHFFFSFSSLAPSAPPQDVECTSLSSTAIRVSWVAPPVSSRNGVLTRYSLAYQAVTGEDTSRHIVDSIPPDVSSWEIKDLEKWTEYRVWVRAHTDVGAGPESPPVIVRTEEDGKCPGGALTSLHSGQASLTLSPASYFTQLSRVAAPSTLCAPEKLSVLPYPSPSPVLSIYSVLTTLLDVTAERNTPPVLKI